MAPKSIASIPTLSYRPDESMEAILRAPSHSSSLPGDFAKQSKNGNAWLCLLGQQPDSADVPVYGSNGSSIEGVVELVKTDGVSKVEVKLEGFLKMHEIAEGGHSTTRLCLDHRILWVKEGENATCPTTMKFSLQIPTTFKFEDVVYPLPPTYGVKLSGLPGFTANIDYTVSATVNKPNISSSWPGRTKALRFIVGTTSVSTPILYYPLSDLPSPLPQRLLTDSNGFHLTPEWTIYESTITAKAKNVSDITTKLYLPASKAYAISEKIPFHLLLSSKRLSLAAFLPLSPTAPSLGRPKPMKLQLMRQSTVDVRNAPTTSGANRNMWRVDCIGTAEFRLTVEHPTFAGSHMIQFLQSDTPTWIAYSGEILVDQSVKTSGFKAAGLSVKDCLLLSLIPPDPLKCPFNDLRQVIGVRLTTRTCSSNESSASGIGGPIYN